MKYIFINENESFGFKTDEINEITENDKALDEAIYNRFFQEQNQGKQFKIKNINGETFEEIFEEYTVFPIPQPKSEIEILKEKNEALENLVAQTNADFSSFMDFYFEMNPDLV